MHLSTKAKIKIASCASALATPLVRALGKDPSSYTCTRRGLDWRLDLNEGVDLAIFLLGAFEPLERSIFAKIVKPGFTVLDVGANIGAHTLPIADYVGPQGKVIAIEPTSWAFNKLKINRELNPEIAERIVPVNAAMLAEPLNTSSVSTMPKTFFSSWRLDGKGESHPIHGGSANDVGDARGMTLDELVTELNLPRVDLIKIDVDGYEPDVLQGGQHTIAHFKPLIFIELCPHVLLERGSSLAKVLGLLNSLGYTLTDGQRIAKPLPTQSEALERYIPTRGSINAIASPSV